MIDHAAGDGGILDTHVSGGRESWTPTSLVIDYACIWLYMIVSCGTQSFHVPRPRNWSLCLPERA